MGCSSSRETAAMETGGRRLQQLDDADAAVGDEVPWILSSRSRTPLLESLSILAEEPPREIVLRRRRRGGRRHRHPPDEARLAEIISLQQSLAAMEDFFQSLLGQAQLYMEAMDPAAAMGGGPPPASEAVLASLPRTPLLPHDFDDQQNKVCGICCEAHVVGEIVTRLPCGHVYHGSCIEPWLHRHCTCPSCRYELATDDPDYETGRVERMNSRNLHTNQQSTTDALEKSSSSWSSSASVSSVEEGDDDSISYWLAENHKANDEDPLRWDHHGPPSARIWEDQYLVAALTDQDSWPSEGEDETTLEVPSETDSEEEAWITFDEFKPVDEPAAGLTSTSGEDSEDTDDMREARKESISLGDCCTTSRKVADFDIDQDSGVSFAMSLPSLAFSDVETVPGSPVEQSQRGRPLAVTPSLSETSASP